MVDKSYEDNLNDPVVVPGVQIPDANNGTQLTPEQLQRKLYFFVDELKKMHGDIPDCFQIRISYDLLTEMANSLLNDTVFAIVKGLMEIQHVTERNLKQMREQAVLKQKEEIDNWSEKISDTEELHNIVSLLQLKHSKELNVMDLKLIALLDQKVHDQQSIMQKAGVAGFYVTNNSKDIKIQMFLLDFILRLSQLPYDPDK